MTVFVSEESQLEYIYQKIIGNDPFGYTAGRSAEWTLSKIGAFTGLDFSSGEELRANKYSRLYRYAFDREWNGPDNGPMILSSIISSSPLFSLRNGLQAYWHLGKQGVVDVKDYGSSPAANLTNVGIVTRAAGPSSVLVDSANFVAASSQRLDFSDFDKLSIVGDATFAGWVYLNDKPAVVRTFFDKWTGTGNQREFYFAHVNTNDRFRVSISLDGTAGNVITIDATTFGAPAVQTWYFIVLQYNSSTKKAKISVNNGAYNESTAGATQPFTGTGVGGFGNNFASGTYFSGRVSEWAKWNRLLSDDEITYLYNGGLGRPIIPLV